MYFRYLVMCQDWLKLARWFLRRGFFKFRKCIFFYFVTISPWKRTGPFIWTNLSPLRPRMLWAKFGWNWPSGSGEEDENVKMWKKNWSEQLTWAFGSGEVKKIATWPSCHVVNFCYYTHPVNSKFTTWEPNKMHTDYQVSFVLCFAK